MTYYDPCTQDVWAVLTDYAGLSDVIPSLVSSEVVELRPVSGFMGLSKELEEGKEGG